MELFNLKISLSNSQKFAKYAPLFLFLLLLVPNCGGGGGGGGSGGGGGAGSTGTTFSGAAGTWQATIQLGETGKETYSISSFLDSSGNVYVGGITSGYLPGCSGVSGACAGGSAQAGNFLYPYDYYISKYNSSGAWQWTVQLGQSGVGKMAYGEVITGDGAGNIYISGYTTGNIAGCNGVSGACGGGSSQGTDDYFISKYNSAGVWQWTKQLGETGKVTYGLGIVTDSGNNVYIAAYTTGNLPGCNGVSGACGGGSATGSRDYFISKYNSAGVWQWTTQLGAVAGSAYGQTLAVDSSDNIIISGYTDANLAALNGVSGVGGAAQGTDDYFISKYNSAGVWQWTKQLGETGKDTYSVYVTTDSSGNVFLTGYTTGYLPGCAGVSGACGGASSQGGGANYDYFISKYNSAGVWQWTKQLGETGKNTTGVGITTDTLGNIYVTGDTTGNLVACAGVSGACGGGSSQGSKDAFVSAYDSSGAWQWTKQLGETGFSATLGSIQMDGSGNLYAAGATTGNIAACNGVSGACGGGSSQAAGGKNDYYILKYR